MQDPAADIAAVAVGTLFVAFCAATQDIAVDAWRIESAPPDMQGSMAAAYQFGYRVAIMAATAGALWIAADYGWRASYVTMAVLMGVGMVATLLTREPEAAVSRVSLLQEQRVVEWLGEEDALAAVAAPPRRCVRGRSGLSARPTSSHATVCSSAC